MKFAEKQFIVGYNCILWHLVYDSFKLITNL